MAGAGPKHFCSTQRNLMAEAVEEEALQEKFASVIRGEAEMGDLEAVEAELIKRRGAVLKRAKNKKKRLRGVLPSALANGSSFVGDLVG